jgi:hypothetical protein
MTEEGKGGRMGGRERGRGRRTAGRLLGKSGSFM